MRKMMRRETATVAETDEKKCVLIKFSSLLIHLGLVSDDPGRNLAAAATRTLLIDFGAAALL